MTDETQVKGNEITRVLEYLQSRKDDRGLIVVSPPTGYGKTYGAREYIVNFLRKRINGEDDDTGIIYITPLVKNLSDIYFEVLGEFSDREKDKVNDNILLLKGKSEAFIEQWKLDNNGESICSSIKDTKEYKRLCGYIKTLCFDSTFDSTGALCDEETFHKEYLSPFVSKAKQSLKALFKKVESKLDGRELSVEEKIDYLLNTEGKEWKWIANYFPAVRTSQSPVLFMSMSKFLFPNSTFVEPSYSFLGDKFLSSRNWIVIMDEFDSCKSWTQNHLIDEAINHNIEIFLLFKIIRKVLEDIESSRSFHKYEKQLRLEQKICREITDFGLLKYDYKVSQRNENVYAFLFDEAISQVYINGKRGNDRQQVLQKENINHIYFTTNKDEEGLKEECKEFSFRQVYVRVLNFLRKIAKDIRYRVDKDSNDFYSDYMTLAGHYTDDEMQKRFLLHLAEEGKTSIRANRTLMDKGFFNTGFNFLVNKEADTHKDISHFYSYSYDVTPERILVALCRRCRVLGMSATALNETPLCNFYLPYIYDTIGDELNKQEEIKVLEESMRNNYNDAIAGYNNSDGTPRIDINTTVLPPYDYGKRKELWEELVGRLNGNRILGYLCSLCESYEDNYKKEYEGRLYGLARAYRDFLYDDVSQSMLAVVMSFKIMKDIDGKPSILSLIYNRYAKEKQICKKDDKYAVRILKGKDFKKNSDGDSPKDKLLKELSNQKQGDKLFIVSCFSTIMSGQNLCYEIPDALQNSVVRICDNYRKENKKDIDSMYIDYPTHLVANIFSLTGEDDFKISESNTRESMLIKSLIEYEELYECLAITRAVKDDFVRKAVSTYTYNRLKTDNYSSIYDNFAVKRCGNQILVQTLGRICRTHCKSKRISITLHNKWTERVDIDHIYEMDMRSPELDSVLKKLEEAGAEKEKNLDSEQFGEKDNEEARVRINKYLSSIFDDDIENRPYWRPMIMAMWSFWRMFFLNFPTLSEAQANVMRNTKISDFLNPLISNIIESEQFENSEYAEIGKNDYNTNIEDDCTLWEALRIFYYRTEIETDNITYKVGNTDTYKDVVIGKGKNFKKTVSAKEARLDKMQLYEPFAKRLQQKPLKFTKEILDDTAISDFKKNKYIIRPIVFNNIYKGGLGELFGKILLEKELNLKLLNITDPAKFEMFDFVTEEGIYIDFKHWRREYVDGASTDEKFYKKLEYCGGTQAWIINCLVDDNDASAFKDGIYSVSRSKSHPELIKVDALFDPNTKSVVRNNIEKLREIYSNYTANK